MVINSSSDLTQAAAQSVTCSNQADDMRLIASALPNEKLSYYQQQRITRVCIRCALLLMQYGAESAVVVDLTKRLGVALGVDSAECGLLFNAVILTTLYQGRCITTVRNTIHQGINVSILVQIQQIVSQIEAQRKQGITPANSQEQDTWIENIESAFDQMDRRTYPNYLMSFFVGGSCASFAYLNGGDVKIALIALVAGFCAMHTRLFLSKHHFNPFVVVILTAFLATLLGASAYFLKLGDDADIAVAASVLLLVPGFPIINALSDILKGYINMGVGRWMFATMLTLSACVGIVIALILLQIPHWGL